MFFIDSYWDPSKFCNSVKYVFECLKEEQTHRNNVPSDSGIKRPLIKKLVKSSRESPNIPK